MPKVLYLVEALGLGGAERQFSLLIKYLPPQWEARVITFKEGPFVNFLREHGKRVDIIPRRYKNDLRPVHLIWKTILEYKPDIVHSWGYLCSAIAAPICKASGVKMVDGSIRGATYITRHQLRTKLSFFLADHVVSNSLAGLATFQISAQKSSVVYNAFDPDRLKLVEGEKNILRDVTTVVMTGRISPMKDFPSFFEAARRLQAREPGRWKFMAIGAHNGAGLNAFSKLAEDLIDAGVVELPDAGMEVLPFLMEANIGVLLSPSDIQEGFSNSIMEYMLCELPVICNDCGGNRELVVDGETGFVTPSENVEAVIEKLLYLREHPEVSKRMGQAGRQRVMSLCAIDKMVSNYESIYTRLLVRGTFQKR